MRPPGARRPPAEPAGPPARCQIKEVVIMTPILSTEDFAALGAPDLVYVRPVKAAEILASVPAESATLPLHPDQVLYAVHRADGERLAVLTDRNAAMAWLAAEDPAQLIAKRV